MLKANHYLKRIFGLVFGAVARDSPSLHSAVAQVGWDPSVAELLSMGARVSEQDADGNTALHVAFLKFGDALIVELLMGRYVRESTRNLVNGDGLSVVHILCTRSCTQLLEKVLAGGRVNVNAKVNPKSNSAYRGYTALHFAVAFEQHEVAELLLSRHRANIYEQDAEGSTPIHLALEHGDVRMIDLLLAFDVERKNVVNNHGLSHFMAACVGSCMFAVMEYLQKAPSQSNDMIYGAVQFDHRFAGYLPLHFAVEFRRWDTARLLMICGARQPTPFDLGDDNDSSSGLLERHEERGRGNVCTRIICVGLQIVAWIVLLLLLLFVGVVL